MSNPNGNCAGARLPDAPPGISPQRLADPNYTGSFADGRVLVAYDPDSRTGGLYLAEFGYWRLYTPIDVSAFMEISARIVGIIQTFPVGASPVVN